MFFKKRDYHLEYSKLGMTYSKINIGPYGERAGHMVRLTGYNDDMLKVSLNREWGQKAVWTFHMYKKEPPSHALSLWSRDPNIWEWYLDSDNNSLEFRSLFDSIVKIYDEGYYEFEATDRDVSVVTNYLSGDPKYVKQIFETLKTMSAF